MSARPSPERTAARIRSAIYVSPYGVPGCNPKKIPAALKALDELVAALAAETARADEAERQHAEAEAIADKWSTAAYDENDRNRALAARLEQARAAAETLCDTIETEAFAHYTSIVTGEQLADALVEAKEECRAALAALQETPPNEPVQDRKPT